MAFIKRSVIAATAGLWCAVGIGARIVSRAVELTQYVLSELIGVAAAPTSEVFGRVRFTCEQHVGFS